MADLSTCCHAPVEIATWDDGSDWYNPVEDGIFCSKCGAECGVVESKDKEDR